MEINISEYDIYIRPGFTDMRKWAVFLSRLKGNALSQTAESFWQLCLRRLDSNESILF